jgi:hypothetical protein
MNYLFGKPVRASGYLSTVVQPIPVEDNATVMIEYEIGVRGIVDVRSAMTGGRRHKCSRSVRRSQITGCSDRGCLPWGGW